MEFQRSAIFAVAYSVFLMIALISYSKNLHQKLFRISILSLVGTEIIYYWDFGQYNNGWFMAMFGIGVILPIILQSYVSTIQSH